MRDRLVLGELLEDPELGLSLVVGGEEHLRRQVRGVHSIELEHPAVWLEPDWIMLTAGLVLRRRRDAQRDLVAELDDAGITALGFGVGPAFSRIPSALVEAARERGFPVFSVPFPTGFGQVERSVHQSLLSTELRLYRRIVTLQDHLVAAFASEAPCPALLERLAEFTEARAAILTAGGRLAGSAGDGPWGSLWEGIAGRPRTQLSFEADGWHVVATPIEGGSGPPQTWLVVTRRTPFVDVLARRLSQAAARLLAAATRMDERERMSDRAARAALLERLVQGPGHDDPDATPASRLLAGYGFDRDEPMRMLAVGTVADARVPGATAAIGARLAAAFEPAGIPHLVAGRDGATIGLAQAPLERLRELVVPLLTDDETALVAGCGREVVGVEGIAESLRDAQLILAGSTDDDRGRLRSFEELDLDMVLLSGADPRSIQPKVDSIVGRLEGHPGAREALVAYFDNDLDIGQTAHVLHLHPNTVRYRLRKVEEVLGRSLRSPSTIATLSLVLTSAGDRLRAPASD